MTAPGVDLAGARAELHSLLAQRAFRFGEFVLSSGRRTDVYVNGKEVTLEGRGLHLCALLLLERCRALDVAAVGGLTLGADPIAAAVAALSGAGPQPLRAFIVRKQAKQHGTGQLIEGPALVRGERVAVVDDVITTGGSLIQAVEAVQQAGAEVVEAIALVDREEGGPEAIAARGVPLHALFTRSDFRPRPAF